MDDEDSRRRRRGAEWFLEKITAGLDAAESAADAPPPLRRKMSRAEIEALVNETLREELARLEAAKPPEPE